MLNCMLNRKTMPILLTVALKKKTYFPKPRHLEEI